MSQEGKKVYMAAYRAANREKIRAQQVAYRTANPEKVKAYYAARYAARQEEAKAYNKAYRAANLETIKAGQAIWRAANREELKAYRAANRKEKKAYAWKRKYGLSPEAYQLMLLEQKNACGICNENFSKYPNVDHCHKTGEVRGLLCGNCNKALGGFKDSLEILGRAKEYLVNQRQP